MDLPFVLENGRVVVPLVGNLPALEDSLVEEHNLAALEDSLVEEHNRVALGDSLAALEDNLAAALGSLVALGDNPGVGTCQVAFRAASRACLF